MEREDVQAGWVSMYKQSDLAAAYAHDRQLTPRSLGYCGNGRTYARERTQQNVTYDTP